MSESINSNNKENYSKFVVSNSTDIGEDGRTESVDLNSESKGNQFGQVKYAKRGNYQSIYDDPTRDTANDTDAYKRSCEGVEYPMDGDDGSEHGQR